MDGVELELTCLCGYEHFERVVVQRKPHAPVVTDFVACVGRHAMYLAPVPMRDPPEWQVGHGMGAIGGPQSDYKGSLFGPRTGLPPMSPAPVA